jgi:hypothetical protein
MNIERLEQVEQWLLAGAPERLFNMGTLVDVPYEHKNNWCGTSCCIAGYVFSQEVPFDRNTHNSGFNGFGDVEPVAAKALGLDEKVAERLFYIMNRGGFQYDGDWADVTADHAAQAVRNVIEHGEPLWENILEFYEDDGDC